MRTLNGVTSGSSATNLSLPNINAELRKILHVGTTKVAGQMGTKNGFNLNPSIHIPLPATLACVDITLPAIGMSSLTDEFELQLNHATKEEM